jgi:4-amino-4-deoxy-L-arabinose transferase-like glycosyltransferase
VKDLPLPPPKERGAAWIPIALIVGCAAFYLVRLGAAGLYDPNEGQYAEIPREMVLLGDWITPHFNFVRYFEKPPLLYWLTALAYSLLGVSQFSARIVTACAAVAGIGIVYGIGRDLWGRRAGLLSGLILATCLGHFIFSRIVLTDMLFTVLLAASFWGLLRGLLADSPRSGSMLAAYGGVGLAVLTKGLIGLVFPVLTLGGYLLLARDRTLWRRLDLLRGSLVVLAVAAPWHILVGLRNEGFFWFYFINEHVLRFLAKRDIMDYAPLPVWTYLAMVLAWMFPWCVFVPAALWRYVPRHRPRTREERGDLFVTLWAAAVIGFFLFSPSRLEYYSMPAFPALALLVGRLWDGELAGQPLRRWRNAATYSILALLVAGVLLVPAVWLFPKLERISFYNMLPAIDAYSRDVQYRILSKAEVYTAPSYEEVVPLLHWASAFFLVATVACAGAWLRRRPRLAFACLVAGMLPTLTLAHTGIIVFEPHRSVAELAGIVRREFRPGDQIIIDGPYENFAGVNFYTGQRARVVDGFFGDLVFSSRYPDAKGVFLKEAELGEIWRGERRVFLFSDSPSRLGKLEAFGRPPVVLGRTGKNWLFSNRPGPSG